MRNIKGTANSSSFLGVKIMHVPYQGSWEIIFVHKSWNYINLEGNRLWNPINLCSGFQTTFSFHPSPLPTKLRHQVWDWSIYSYELRQSDQITTDGFWLQDVSTDWCLLNHHHLSPPDSHPPPPPPQCSGKSHYFIILEKYLSKR